MSLNTKRFVIAFLSFMFLLALLLVGYMEGNKRVMGHKAEIKVPDDSKQCVECHNIKTPSLIAQWQDSKHALKGVGCMECHGTEEGDPDIYKHHGAEIAVIVSPKDCSKCHSHEFEEFQKSHHATAGQILGSLDNTLAEVVEGSMGRLALNGQSPAAISGCTQCHGSVVKIMDNGKPDPATWPNTGIGRLNPDGSKGSCAACHSRHSFSPKLARNPENCGKCHLGPDHPQKEIYDESKHGVAFRAFKEYMNLDAQPWRVGIEYTAAPTCATCHMSATETQAVTHDVGDRISWTLRPPVSEKIDAKAKKLGKDVLSWQDRRENMQDVCIKCHSTEYVDGFYQQFDAAINLYNEKFGKPSTKLYKMMKESKLLSDVAFDDELEWTYFYLWHHEGRRARHGAAMMGPDYTQWHGFYEVAERWYIEFIPQTRELCEEAIHHGSPAEKKAAKEVLAELDKILNAEEHEWFIGKMSDKEKARRKAAAAEFKKRYVQD